MCVCFVLAAFARAWNDGLPDHAARNEYLLPLVSRFVGTMGLAKLAERLSLMAADWLVRTHTPAWLRLACLSTQADALAGLGVSKFGLLVQEGYMPKPRRVGSRLMYDVDDLRAAFKALPYDDPERADNWGEVDTWAGVPG